MSRWKLRLVSVFTSLLSSVCWANPTGGQVTSGAATIQQVGGQMTITQSTDRAIIQWQNFSIPSGESVRFIQPGALSAVLNRVTGVDPSIILGALRANGQVFLVNPNGVFFGPGSTVDVSGLVVSTLNLKDQDFLNGNFDFTQDASKQLASIVNQGTLKVADNGFVLLASPLISNEGLILAQQGRVALAAGEKTSISFDPNNLVHFEVSTTSPESGKVLLPQQAVSDVLRGVVARPGVIDSTELVLVNGEYELRNGSGIALNSGQIVVDGTSGSDAGQVRIDSTRATVLTESSQISAAGRGENSNGGSIYLLSQGQAAALKGSVVDIGAGSSGDGGFVELSGSTILAGLNVKGEVSRGKKGVYLIDPAVLFVADGPDQGAPDTVYEEDLESSVVDVVLLADETVFVEDIFDDEITLAPDINLSITTTDAFGDGLIFEDDFDSFSTSGVGKIQVTTAADIVGGGLISEDSVTIDADGEVGAFDSPVTIVAPDVSINAGGDILLFTDTDTLSATSSSGSITLEEFDDIFLDNLVADGSINVTADGDISGSIIAGDNSLLFSNLGTIGTESSPVIIDVDGDLLVSAGDEVGGRSITLSGTATDGVLAVNTTPGDVVFNGGEVSFVNIADVGEFLQDFTDDDVIDLALSFGLLDEDIEDLQEQLGLSADIRFGDRFGEGDFGDFGPDGFDDFDGPDGFEGPDGMDGPEGMDGGPEAMEGPEGMDGPGEGEEGSDSGKDKKKERRKDNGNKIVSGSPIIAQAGLRQQNFTTAALVKFRVEALPQLTVNVEAPSPFDAALQRPEISADDILDLTALDLYNFDISLSYDINGDPILTNPNLRAGDLFELNVGDLSEVPLELNR